MSVSFFPPDFPGKQEGFPDSPSGVVVHGGIPVGELSVTALAFTEPRQCS